VTAAAVRDAIRELARELAVLLPERADAITTAFERARANPENLEARETLRVLVHRLRGSAGSHGFDGLSREAGLIEDCLLAEGESLAEAGTWQRLAARVGEIRIGAERAAREAEGEGLAAEVKP
jgi:HPt (histidine-containing phosphotransfer) domain-containing protein